MLMTDCATKEVVMFLILVYIICGTSQVSWSSPWVKTIRQGGTSTPTDQNSMEICLCKWLLGLRHIWTEVGDSRVAV